MLLIYSQIWSRRNMCSKTNRSLFVFINLINLSSALVCPTYLPRQQNASQYRLIKSCQTDCQFPTVDEKHTVCLGIYSNYSGEMFIKQLGAISADKQCLMSKQCILEMDLMKSQTFTCCCSTDNCTLNWTSISPARVIVINSTTISSVVIIEQEHFSWKLFLMIFICLMIIILITFIFSLWKSLKTSNKEKNKTSFLKSPSSTSLMEQLFFSAQQIVIGKNSTVYKAIFENEVTALKVYKQDNLLMWKNEVTILRSIKHESIVKYVLGESTLLSFIKWIRITHNNLIVYLTQKKKWISYSYFGWVEVGNVQSHISASTDIEKYLFDLHPNLVLFYFLSRFLSKRKSYLIIFYSVIYIEYL